ncbi:MAG: penicillin-binding transpeptidase domain-containing protein [Ardenticatenia bacterium]|nr:penicillin-binding transpeptidase domain-containing protein [Ardenticatenia bacterium]
MSKHGATPRIHKDPRSSDAVEQRLHARRRRRIFVVLAVFVGMALVLAWRLTYWQLIARDQVLRHRAAVQVRPAQQPPRGTIRDRNGYLLAIDTTEYKVGVSPNLVAHAESLAQEVAPILGRPEDELVALFSRNDAYIPIAASLPYTVGQALVNLNNPALVIEPVLKRAYPNGPMAAHVLGFVNEAGTGYGVERIMAEWLGGQVPPNEDGDPVAEEIKLGARPFAPMREGVDVILTLDRNVQFMAEQELADAVARYDAEGGTIIVMDPKAGDILAMANWPSYDPNQYATTPPDLFANPATAKQYEPGSVFKAITVASALDSGAISPNLIYRDTGVLEVGGRLIRKLGRRGPWHHHPQ